MIFMDNSDNDKRFLAACAALQGILSYEGSIQKESDAEEVAKKAWMYADKLIKQELCEEE